MRKNKKALMGMLMAMVLSMGAMGGFTTNSDVGMQQISVATGAGASIAYSEGDTANFIGSSATSTVCAGIATACVHAGIAAGGITPASLGCYAGAAVACL